MAISIPPIDAMLHELDSYIDREGWNQPPRLYLVFTSEFHGPRLSEVPGFTDMAIQLRPPMAVNLIAQRLFGHQPRSSDTYGWLVATEVWGVVAEVETEAEHERLSRIMQEPGSLSLHPESRLMRTLVLVTYAGQLAILVRTKDGHIRYIEDNPQTRIAGALSNAMRLLVGSVGRNRY